MRKFLLGLTVLAGGVVTAAGAEAASLFMALSETMPGRAVAQPAQYYGERPVQYSEDWRYREWRRREEFERFRRHQEWRHQRHEEHEHYHRGW